MFRRIKISSRILTCCGLLAAGIFQLPAQASTVLGAYLPGDGWQPGEMGVMNSSLVKPLAIQNVFSAFTHTWDQLYWQSTYIHESGATPLISWMPIDISRPDDNLLEEIVAGNWDAYIDSWAMAMLAWVEQYPVETRPTILIRFAHEFNGNWYSYANTPDLYKEAWRYTHQRFEQSGANQHAQWVWSANNVSADDFNDITLYYPGDDVTDWTSLDGYNWGSNYDWSAWEDFTTTFGPAYNLLVTQYPDKPVMIAEMSSTEPADIPDSYLAQYGDDSDRFESKDTWMLDALANIEASFSAVKAVLLFNTDKELSWSISESHSTGLNGFNSAIATSHFVTSLSDALTPYQADDDSSSKGKSQKGKKGKGSDKNNIQQRVQVAVSPNFEASGTESTSETPLQKVGVTTIPAQVELPAQALQKISNMREGLRNMQKPAAQAFKNMKLRVIVY